jgi:TetR/AcrR family transcriptional regulator, cholesterol catabolism regulator
MSAKSLIEKKEYIAKIAGDVFFAKGYKESSLQDISAKGKLSKAGIYHYFKSKAEILSYLMLKHADGLTNALKQGLSLAEEKKLDPRETFEVLGKKYASYLLKNRKISLVVLRDRHQLTGKERKKLIEKERIIFQIFRNKLREIPSINTKIDINLMTFQVLSSSHWMGYWFDSMGPLTESEAVDEMMNIIFNGILNSNKGKGFKNAGG